jgi:hypothetical protein
VELAPPTKTGRILGDEAGVEFAFAASVPVTVQNRSIRIDRHTRDGILRISGGAVGAVQVASVFAREPLSEPLALTPTESGLTLTAGGVAIAFRRQRGRLTLDSVGKK